MLLETWLRLSPRGWTHSSQLTVRKSRGSREGVATGFATAPEQPSWLWHLFIIQKRSWKRSQSWEINASRVWFTPSVLAPPVLAVIQKMQEVKQGGQRKSSGTSGRARCSLCHSCCYKGCLNPWCLAQSHSSQPTCWPAAQCFCAGSVGGKCQASPRLLALQALPFLLTHPHTLLQVPRSDLRAGQEAGARTGAWRNQAQRKAHTETEAISSAFFPHQAKRGKCQWKAWVTEVQ